MRALQQHLRYWFYINKGVPKRNRNDPQNLKLSQHHESIRLNQKINNSTTDKDLMKLLTEHGQTFDIVNTSTFIKNYSLVKNRSEESKVEVSKLLLDQLKHQSIATEKNVRSLSNIMFYITSQHIKEEFKECIDECLNMDLEKLLELSNGRQTMMITIALCRLGEIERLRQLLPTLRGKLTSQFEMLSMLKIWAALLRVKLTDSDLDRLFSDLLVDVPIMTIKDYSTFVYCYSKCSKELLTQETRRRLADYPKKDIFNIEYVDLSTLMNSISNIEGFEVDDHFFDVMLLKVEEFRPERSNQRNASNILIGIRGHLHKRPELQKAFEKRLILFANMELMSEPIDLQSVTSMFYDLIRVPSYSEELVAAMEKLMMNCILPENKHRFINMKPKFVFRMLHVFKIHKDRHPEYTLDLNLKSAVGSYICREAPLLRQEELLELIQMSIFFFKSQPVCLSLIEAMDSLIKRSPNKELIEVRNKFCLLKNIACFGCKDHLKAPSLQSTTKPANS